MEDESSPVTPRAIGPTLPIAVKPVIVPSPIGTAPLEVRTVSFCSVPKETATDTAFSTPSSARAVPASPAPEDRAKHEPASQAILIALVSMAATTQSACPPHPRDSSAHQPVLRPSPRESRRTLSSS